MIIEHVAIWTNQLEEMKDFYARYFDGRPNVKYTNQQKDFHSYFLTFKSGARLELMAMPSVLEIKMIQSLHNTRGLFILHSA
ncbi:MAG: glyoxalase [Chitinophagaceae bacterium]|nr:glyoxalase [Chitinophagaceae bacterium]